jgi:FtsP/CotA-like multicopper oxidase with cupredoxin domain
MSFGAAMMRSGLMLMGWLGAVGCGGDVPQSGRAGRTDAGGAMTGTPPFLHAVTLPPVLTPTSSDSSGDHYDLTIKAGTAQMRPGAATPIVGFNGMVPGPTIIATKGRPITVTQTNAWSENVTIHNHGHKVAADSDGHPVDYITPGNAKVYHYPNDQRASTYWYHDHTMSLTDSHVYYGLAGFYIIHDPAEDSLNLPSGSHDVPLLLQTKLFNADNTLSTVALNKPLPGEVPVVDGVATPYLAVDTSHYRLRLLNGTSHRVLTLYIAVDGASAGEPFSVIGSDGGLLAAPVEETSLPMAPGERYDLVFDFSRYPVGTHLTLIDAGSVDSANNLSVGFIQFVVTASGHDTSSVPAHLSTISRYLPFDAVSTTQVQLGFNGSNWVINGQTYDPARIDETSKLDTVYIWELSNHSVFNVLHPFHKHLTQFQILDINGQPPPPYQAGWKDTIKVNDGGTTRIIFKNETFTGTYVFHCHKLDHEDEGMMAQEQVSN